ncbi:MAG: NifB/NifX family molybdenum-iron cluster-binding protein [Dethiosulfatibacter sp.]|nr:NifB/NifX family molybdenum-iron cluster-binding protein [Dethiosulfatibacter sp.]
MKIAIASENNMVTEHFGHCESFSIFDAENDRITNSIVISNPGHKPGFLPEFLGDMGINVIIAGGMGNSAIQIFNGKGIEVIVGAKGETKTVAEQYLQGNLKTTGSVCHQHQNSGDCSN